MRLLDHYAASVAALFAVTAGLPKKRGADIPKALAEAQVARADCQSARSALRQHEAEHGCTKQTESCFPAKRETARLPLELRDTGGSEFQE